MIEVLVISLFLSWTNYSLGQNFDINGRIVNGVNEDIRGVPYQVVIHRAHFSCGGSLVKFNWVLTAAYCTNGLSSQQIRVSAGSNFTDGIVMRSVSRIFQQSNFNPITRANDISLLKLVTPFAASPTIGIIPLAPKLPKENAVLTVSGFGSTSAARHFSANVTMLSLDACRDMYNSDLTQGMICASAANLDNCAGEGGDALTYNGQLLGIVSFGNGCADSYLPGIFTSIPFFTHWIRSTIAINTREESIFYDI